MIEKIREIIEKVVDGGVKFLVTASEKPDFGHYSTNVGFFLKENLEDVARRFQEDGGTLFEKVEVKGKFINFWVYKNALVEELARILKSKKLINSSTQQLNINLEFISANPTGPLTMANGRGGFLGDALGNVFEAVGHKVTREYYINDAGNQVKILGESVLAALGKESSKENHYQGGYIKEIAKKLESKIDGGIDVEGIGRLAAAELLKEIKSTTQKAGIKFDVWFSEYEKLRKGSLLKKILGILEKDGLVEKKEGAVWLKTSDIADDKDRVLVKSDGQPTYFLSDLAYHYDKFVKRKFDKAIDIWGADHHGYVARLKAGVKAIGAAPEKLTILITQLVRLVENGQEVKMSKRSGEFITMDELIQEVGKDAARFFFLLHTPESHMDFDLGLAKERSLKNPVYYIQYAYVRCGSILAKSFASPDRQGRFREKAGVKKVSANWDLLEGDSELNLLRELVKLPDLILQTAADYQVSRLARYSMELSKAIHYFYEKERVIGVEEEIMKTRLALVAATREILGRLFDLLGISKPEKM